MVLSNLYENFIGFGEETSSGVTPPPPLLLDTLGADPILAVSFRKLRAGYTGNCVRVRRVPENDTQDFGFMPNGLVDLAGIAAFVNGGSSIAYIDTWYGQQGGIDAGLNLTQSALAQQPRIRDIFNESINYNVDVTKPSAAFSEFSREDRLTTGNISGTLTNRHTIYLVGKRRTTNADDAWLVTNGNLPVLKSPSTASMEYYITGYSPGVNGQFFSNTNTALITTPFIYKQAVDGVNGFTATFNKTRSQTATFTDASSFTPITGVPLTLGYWFSSTRLLGNISEFILVPDVARTDTNIEDEINNFYGVY